MTWIRFRVRSAFTGKSVAGYSGKLLRANLSGLITTMALGNGAEFCESPNLSLPRRNRISCFMTY